MAITYSMSAQGSLLRVKASGTDENLQEVTAYGEAIIQSALAHNCTRILCDETELVYALGTFDTFRAAEHIAKVAPKVAKIALICHPDYLADAKFWENVAVNRGLRVRMFLSLDKAEQWMALP